MNPFHTQQDFLFSQCEPQQIISADGDVKLFPAWISPDEADQKLECLARELAWQQSMIRINGRRIPIPRLNAWYGDAGCHYRYSGIGFEPMMWTSTLLELREQIQTTVDGRFNSVLANLYRDGDDSVAWHSDDEPELGRNPIIASLSLGATRCFKMKHKTRTDIQPISLNLPSGSLLVMSGSTQTHWLHQITKTKKSVGRRVNLTFRFIYQ